MHAFTDKNICITAPALRPVLITLVVLTHVPWTYYNANLRGFELGSDSFWMTLFTYVLASSAVPTLSLLSGYFAWSSLRRRSYLGTIRNKLRTLLAPMLIWNAVMIAVIIWKQSQGYPMRPDLPLLEGGPITLLNALVAFDSIPANPPLYFLRDLLVCFLLLPIVSLLTSDRLIGAISAATLMYFTLIGAKVPYGIFIRIDIFSWFVIGFYFARHGFPQSWAFNTFNIGLLGSAFLTICSFATLYCLSGNPVGYKYVQKIVNLFGPITVIGLTMTLIGGKILRNAASLSKYSFSMFLCHAPVIFLTGELWGYVTHTYIGSSKFIAPLFVALTIMATTFCIYHANDLLKRALNTHDKRPIPTRSNV